MPKTDYPYSPNKNPQHETTMSTTFTILMVLTMIAVLASLVIGIFSMAKGGEFDRKYANKLMRARIFLQASALGFFILALLAYKK